MSNIFCNDILLNNENIGHFVDEEAAYIGDVHGCSAEFENLIINIREVYGNIKIVQLGDLLDRGPDVLGVLEVVKAYDIITVAGNHDWNLIQEVNGKECRSRERKKTLDIIDAMCEADRNFILDIIKSSYTAVTFKNHGGSHSIPTSVVNRHLTKYNDRGIGNFGYYSGEYDHTSSVPAMGVDKWVHGHQHWNYTHIKEQFAEADRNIYNVDSGCVYGEHLTSLVMGNRGPIDVFIEQSKFKFNE